MDTGAIRSFVAGFIKTEKAVDFVLVQNAGGLSAAHSAKAVIYVVVSTAKHGLPFGGHGISIGITFRLLRGRRISVSRREFLGEFVFGIGFTWWRHEN